MATESKASGEIHSTEPDAAFSLAAIVDSSFDAIVSKDLNSIIRSWNSAAERMFGYKPEEAIGRSVVMLIPENLHSEETDIIERIRKGERVESFETTRVRKDGSRIAVSLTISPIKDARGAIVGASKIARDITATKEAEQRIRTLLREVNHRMKNQFQVILSIIRETSNRATSSEVFEREVRDRVLALSRSHDLLVNSDWSGANLSELIYEHLTVFGHEQKVVISGPLVTLNANAVQHVGMAMHELGTNSSKYGVLRNGLGIVDISWQIDTDHESAQTLRIDWEERLEAPVANSTERRGFGSVVLERVVPVALGGIASMNRSGLEVHWSMAAPLSNMAQPAVIESSK